MLENYAELDNCSNYLLNSVSSNSDFLKAFKFLVTSSRVKFDKNGVCFLECSVISVNPLWRYYT